MSIRVLVVDDDPAIRQMLEMTLSFEGFEVDCVGDGAEALEHIRRRRPDVILLDLMMPVMDGIQVATALRSFEETAHIPIIVLTARANETDVWNGWQSGVDSYITKPFAMDPLLAELSRVLAAPEVPA